MPRLAALVAALVMAGCATTTVREREAAAVTQMAVGAPLIIMGSLGGAGVGVGAAAFAASKQLSFDAYAVPFVLGGIASAAELSIGIYLLSAGRANYLDAESERVAEQVKSKPTIQEQYEKLIDTRLVEPGDAIP